MFRTALMRRASDLSHGRMNGTRGGIAVSTVYPITPQLQLARGAHTDTATSRKSTLQSSNTSIHTYTPPTILMPRGSLTHSGTMRSEDQKILAAHTPFEITFLGTASGRPTPVRNVSSLAIRFGEKGKRTMLVDCGDGTQLRWMNAAHLSMEHLSFICITHMHGDHIFGLPNLVAAACNKRLEQPLHIFGPQGISHYIKTNLAATHTWMDRPIVFHELLKNNIRARSLPAQPDVLYHQNPDFSNLSMQVYEDAEITLHAGVLKHRDLNCFGYVLTEKSSLSGSKYKPRKAVVLGDTCDSIGIAPVAMDADVLVHEATFLESESSKVYTRGHSTCSMAGKFGSSIRANHILLTHFSHRYISSELTTHQLDLDATVDHVTQCAHAAGHHRVHAAHDLRVFHVLPTPIVNAPTFAGTTPTTAPVASHQPTRVQANAAASTSDPNAIHVAMPTANSPKQRRD